MPAFRRSSKGNAAAMTDQHGGPPARAPIARSLEDALVKLAGTPDDDSSLPAQLRSIIRFAADLLPPVAYASMTSRHEDAYVTVAISSAIALAVDEAQYADQAGPCLDALRMGAPTAVPAIDAVVQWPGFRDTALRLGLRASLSIPLFAGQGVPIAALNLYGHDTAAMAPLSLAVVAAYDSSAGTPADPESSELDPESRQLVDGLTGAFAVRAQIQQALGVIMAEEHANADFAYAVLRARAAADGLSLTAAAGSIVTTAGDEQRPA
jgi:GAF domain-containing protein